MSEMNATQGNPTQDQNEKDAQIARLNRGIDTREKQLADMANMLAELNQQLSEVHFNFFLRNFYFPLCFTKKNIIFAF